MGRLSRLLRDAAGGALFFRCPGCSSAHQVQVGDGPGPRWQWNGDVEAPTFVPSVLVRGIREDMDEATWLDYDALADGPGGATRALDDPRFRTVCHSYITAGRIRFLSDCTHALAGQTVPLAEWAPE